MRLLLVEDDEMIAETVLESLRSTGYAVDWAADGRAAELSLANGVYDLVLLDLGLPRKDGIALLTTYRKADGAAAVIILTARDAVDDRIRGLDAGADDYLLKPFDLKELGARIRAALRRRTGQKQPVYAHGDLTLDPSSHEARKTGQLLPLVPREFGLLQVLIEEPSRVFTRAMLEEKLYGWGDEVGSNTIEVHVHSLRKKIGAETDHHRSRGRLSPQAMRMNSIRRWLLGWLIFGLATACAIAGYSIFHTARDEAGELFDYELRTVAESLPPTIASTQAAQLGDHELGTIADDRIVIDIWDALGNYVYHSAGQAALGRLPSGIRSVERDELHWRVFGLQRPDRFIQVAQPISVRDDLALRLAWRTLWPLTVLVPVTIALVLWVVARGLAPIGGVSRALATRSIDSLEPVVLARRVPVEIRPLVEALNDLLQRMSAATEAQHTFVADAAHELRSPLAALKLQFQASVRDGSMSGEPRSLERLENRLNRTIHLAHQLLTMAREDASPAYIMKGLSLRTLAEEVVGDYSAQAEAAGIDLGLEFEARPAPAEAYKINGEPHSLSVLLSNLVDNAIRHTPPGGKVDVLLLSPGSSPGFEVIDNGPGIPEPDLARVFDRFYRGENAKGSGSGLGLAIVARIAQRHGASLMLKNRAGGGLCVSVRDFHADPVSMDA